MKDYLTEIERIIQFEPDPAFARRARIIFENLSLSGNEKVLEIGCGRGFYLNVLSKVFPKLDITGIDLNEEYLSIAKKFINEEKVKLVKTDATNLPFKDKSFDRIIASEILEHIPNDGKAIFEMYRVLKSSGTIMATVPNKNYSFLWDPLNWILERTIGWHLPSNIWWLSGIWADHVRLYDEKGLRTKVEKAGFKVEKIWHATHFCFPFSHFLFYGIGKNLVEKGLLPGMNRFSSDKKMSILAKILLFPIKYIDSFNKIDSREQSSINIICRLTK